MILTVPQLLTLTGTGAMKSFSSSVKVADERVLKRALPKALQVPGGKTPAAVRLTDASPKVSCGRLTVSDGSTGSETVAPLMAASATPAPNVLALPQHAVWFDPHPVVPHV